MLVDLTEDEKDYLFAVARKLTGCNLLKEQHSVVINSVMNRMRKTSVQSLDQYLVHVSESQEELAQFISAVTIHTTEWFRELAALEIFKVSATEAAKNQPAGKVYRVLSIACSTGQEVYSILTILTSIKDAYPKFLFEIEGWDIDPISLRTARSGIYDLSECKKYLSELSRIITPAKSDQSKIQVSPEAMRNVTFRSVNITLPPNGVQPFDYVFCRNMLIYFEKKVVNSILSYAQSILCDQGRLCIGVSETGLVADLGFRPCGLATFVSMRNTPPEIGLKTQARFFGGSMRRVLIVDDEPDLCELTASNLADAGYSYSIASTARDALEIMSDDVGFVLCDYLMPGNQNGVQLCATLRARGYRGVFAILSGHADPSMSREASQFDCDEVILKPIGRDELIRTLQRYERLSLSHIKTSGLTDTSQLHAILLGASTGGTEVLAKLLENLPREFPPIVVVQHIAHSFARDFALRLEACSGLKLADVTKRERLKAGHIYLSLGDYHVGIRRHGESLEIFDSVDASIRTHRPSIDFLFESAAKTKGKFIAALFTGMGKDGAAGLKALRDSGSSTVAQDEKSCVVFGMPAEAIRVGAAEYVMNPLQFREYMLNAAKSEKVKRSSI